MYGIGSNVMVCAGRTHQIRLHCAASGHPIIGDNLYGISSPMIQRHALHATKLSLRHPLSSDKIQIVAPLPEDIKKLAAACKFHTCVY